MRNAWIGFWIAFVAVASADVVHLTSGRKVKGEVISETEAQVVVRVAGSGRLTFPRKLVRKIERESQGATRLALARDRSREGAWDEALKLYRTAAKDADPAIAEAAQRELAELEEARAEAARQRKARAAEAPQGAPSGARSTPKQPAARGPASNALADLLGGRARKALPVFASLHKRSPKNTRYAYLHARCLELTGSARDAEARYRTLLGPKLSRRDATPAWLGEILRRKLSGEALTPDSPGVEASWSRVEAGDDFVVYHPFPRIESWLRAEPAKALTRVLERLNLERKELVWGGRVQVFLFPNKRAYEAADGMELAAGHAQLLPAPDGGLVQIRAYPLRSFYQTTFPHEIAHAVLYFMAQRLPSWAHEGAAQYCESPRARVRSRAAMLGAQANGTLPTVRELLAGEVPRGDDQAAVSAYYGLNLVVFEALVELTGDPKQALDTCTEIGLLGAEAALAKRSISWKSLDAAVDKASTNTAAGD